MSKHDSDEGRLQIAVRGSVIHLRLGTDTRLEVSTAEAPELIRQLLVRGRRFSAKAIYEAWWVALADEHGIAGFTLDGERMTDGTL